jgi:hypothetical protein
MRETTIPRRHGDRGPRRGQEPVYLLVRGHRLNWRVDRKGIVKPFLASASEPTG